MLEYALQGLLIGMLGIAALALLRNATPGSRIIVGSIALVGTTIPWQWFSTWWNTPNVVLASLPIEPLQRTKQELDTLTAPASQTLSFGMDGDTVVLAALLSATILGLLAYIAILWQTQRKLNTLRIAATLDAEATQRYGHAAWIVPNSQTAMASGIWRKEIWLSAELSDNQERHLVMTHEQMHHRLHHPLANAVITCINCLLWWHPLVRYFVKRLRQDLELQCDHHCKALIPDGAYQRGLAHLALQHAQMTTLTAHWYSRTLSVRQRIEHMNQQRPLTLTRKVTSVMLLLAGALGVIGIHAEPTPTRANPATSSKQAALSATPVPSDSNDQQKMSWNVRMENASLDDVMQQTANMGGIQIYLAPNVQAENINLETARVSHVEELLDEITQALAIGWHKRGGIYVLGDADSLRDPNWLPEARIYQGHGGLMSEQNSGSPSADPNERLMLNIKLTETQNSGGYGTSEMKILMNKDTTAALRQGHVYLSFSIAREDQSGEALDVSLYLVDTNGQMEFVGRDHSQIEENQPIVFEWPAASAHYTLELLPLAEA